MKVPDKILLNDQKKLVALEAKLRRAKSAGNAMAASKLLVEIYNERAKLKRENARLWETLYGKGKDIEEKKRLEDEISAEESLQAAEIRKKNDRVSVKLPKDKKAQSEDKIDFNYLMEHREATSKALQASLLHFIVCMHKYIYGTDFIIKGFHVKLIKKLEDFVFGKQEKRNLYIGLCPRVGKSQIVKYFIAWSYAINPHCNFMATSYDDELAMGISEEVMAIISCPFYQKIFPYTTLDIGNRAKGSWQTSVRGKFRAASLRGGLTGHGAGSLTKSNIFGGAIVIDDFQKPLKGISEADNDEIKRIYYETLKSRKNSSDTPILIIAQRIGYNDLIADIKETEPEDWDFFVLPALQEDGSSIWEEKIAVADLLKMKERQKDLFYSQYQQDPKPLGGDMIKGEWFRYYIPSEELHFKKMFGVFDTALKKGQEHDYTAGGLFGLTLNNHLHWLDLFHAKLTVPEVEASILLKWQEWQRPYGGRRCGAIYIEDKASGTSIIQNLRAKSNVIVIPIKVVDDKVQRVNDAIPFIASGQVYLPQGRQHYMSNKIINEVELFTNKLTAPHDDITDVLCHACKIAFQMSNGLF